MAAPAAAAPTRLEQFGHRLRHGSQAAAPPPARAHALLPQDRDRIVEMAAIVAQVTTQIQKSGGASKESSFFDWVPKKFRNDPIRWGVIGLGLGAAYSFYPVQVLLSWSIRGVSAIFGGLSEAGLPVIPPFVQAAGAYYGYQWVKTGAKPGETKPEGKDFQIPKHVAVAGLVLGMDAAINETAKAVLLAPAVRNTIAVCLAVDYANAAIKEGAVIPKNIVNLAYDAKQKTAKALEGMQSLYDYSTDPDTLEKAQELYRSSKESLVDGFKTIYAHSGKAAALGTTAAVGALAIGLPNIGAILAMATGVPLGFSCEKLEIGFAKPRKTEAAPPLETAAFRD